MQLLAAFGVVDLARGRVTWRRVRLVMEENMNETGVSGINKKEEEEIVIVEGQRLPLVLIVLLL